MQKDWALIVRDKIQVIQIQIVNEAEEIPIHSSFLPSLALRLYRQCVTWLRWGYGLFSGSSSFSSVMLGKVGGCVTQQPLENIKYVGAKVSLHGGVGDREPMEGLMSGEGKGKHRQVMDVCGSPGPVLWGFTFLLAIREGSMEVLFLQVSGEHPGASLERDKSLRGGRLRLSSQCGQMHEPNFLTCSWMTGWKNGYTDERKRWSQVMASKSRASPQT